MLLSIIGYSIPLLLIVLFYRNIILSEAARNHINWYGKNGIIGGDTIESKIAEITKDAANKQLYALLTSYFAFTLNHIFGLIPAWYVLAFSGICLYFFISVEQNRLAYIEYSRKMIDENHYQWAKAEGRKSAFIGLVVVLTISGNWAYQVNKNFNELKDRGTNEALNLVGNSWCANFADINVYDAGETVVKTGGWPCIKISAVNNLQFKRSEKDPIMCLQATLDEEKGLPGQDSFNQGIKFETVCAPSNWWEGWSSDNFSGKIYDQLKMGESLDRLQSRLCANYSNELTVDERITYC